MANPNKNIVNVKLKGERAAMSGYLPQYDEFAIRVYDAIAKGELEEIRVADTESNVGKLDDIVYVTTSDVYAYQVKYTSTDDRMSYLDFKYLIPKIVDGWRKLKNIYPDKTIHPKLLTNKKLTDSDHSIKSLVGENVDGFVAYESEVLRKLTSIDTIDTKWTNAIAELKNESTLTGNEWDSFWQVFVFSFDYQQELIEVEKSSKDQRVRYIVDIHRMLQEMAARKTIKLTTREIISKLGWQNRFETKFDHNLIVPEESYVPNAAGITQLSTCLQKKNTGYIFLKGTPGSGKSTLLTQWLRGLSNPYVRFYAFDFLNPSSQRNNDSTRGSGVTFLNDIVIQIHNLGIRTDKTLPLSSDLFLLKNMFYSQLNAISKRFEETRVPFIIVIDGLDHITREYSVSEQTLMELLPSPIEIPQGVVFVLGSQHFDNLKLNRLILKETESKENIVEMPPLAEAESDALCKKLLNKDLSTDNVINKCWLKSQGHPLYLRYLLNQITIEGASVLDTVDDSPQDVNEYYSRIVDALLESTVLKDALGLLTRITGVIHMDDVRHFCTEGCILDFKKKMWHLFRYDKAGQELTFFHNSFRQYLLNKTTEDVLTGEYQKDKDVSYYRQLSVYFKGTWEYGYYLYKAELYETFISELTPEHLFKQAQNYRPIWSIHHDLENGIDIARQQKDPYLLIRYLLFENQLSQMDNQNYGVISLVKDFIRNGQSSLAKSVIREGRVLHCSQEYAMNLAIEFLKIGDREEANLLFELSYPSFLSLKVGHSHTYQNSKEKFHILKTWVKSASYFIEWLDIERYIASFTLYLKSLTTNNNEQFDSNEAELDFVREYLESLVEQERWRDLENSIRCFFYEEKYQNVVFLAYDKAIVHLNETNPQDEELLSLFFTKAETAFKRVKTEKSDNLRMAYLAYKSNQPKILLESYINKVDWTDLGSFYQEEIGQSFKTLTPFIFFVKIRALLGIRNDIMEFVPDDNCHQDNELMVNYGRRLFNLAQMLGQAQAGIKDSTFLSLFTFSIKFYDTIENIVPYHKYKYTLSQQRADFYRFAIDSAVVFGEDILKKLANVFETYFAETTCQADSEARRTVILALFRNGYDNDWCRTQLKKIDHIMMEYKDVDGRERECIKQGQAWLELGCSDRAEQLFHQMLKESFGIGYRKDYQPSVFAEWIGTAIKADPQNAIFYIHWLTSRFKHIETIAQPRTRIHSAQTLLEIAFEFNLGTGLKLAKWLLDREYNDFQSVSSALLNALLNNSQTRTEYLSLFRFYTEIYLYTDDVFDINTRLLKRVVTCGKRILCENFAQYERILRKKIETECPENKTKELHKALDEILNTPIKKTETESLNGALQNLSVAQELLNDGRKSEAWKTIISMLEETNSSGWVRYYDGGTRIQACQMLQKIDEERGRDFTINLLARDIPGGYTYGMVQNLDEIVPLLTKVVDPKRLFVEEFSYMNRILREEICCETDKPEIEPDHSSVCEIMRDWLLYLVDMPIVCVMERAKMLLAHLYNESYVNFTSVLSNDSHSERLLLEIGCYLAELKSKRLIDFKEIAKKSAISKNYQYRIYAAIILYKLKEEIPKATYRKLPTTYSMFFVNKKEIPSRLLDKYENLTEVDWSDVDSIMMVASHWCGYLFSCSKIERRTLNFRAVELMKKYGDTPGINTIKDKDNDISNHYNAINLRYPYKKSYVQSALDGMLAVAAELIDGEALYNNYRDYFFIIRDFANINIEASRKPNFIQRIADINAWSVDKNWVDEHSKSPRLNDNLLNYNELIVIGEYTHIKKMADNPLLEEYQAKISFDDEKKEHITESIFGESPFMHNSEDYPALGSEDQEIILMRGGYYIDFPNKSQWIAINPALAIKLGWEPCSNGYFAWQNDIGEKMVESVYWHSGNISGFSRSNYEASEGWIVIASKRAIEDLRKVSLLYSHKMVIRSTENNIIDRSHRTYIVTQFKINQ